MRFAPARLLLLLLVCAVAVSVIRTAPAQAGPTRSEARLLSVMNDARAARGLARLHFGSTIQTYSHSWARYLLLHDAFFHYGRLPAGTSENIGWLTCRRGWAASVADSASALTRPVTTAHAAIRLMPSSYRPCHDRGVD